MVTTNIFPEPIGEENNKVINLMARADFVETRRRALLSAYRENTFLPILGLDHLIEVLETFIRRRECSMFRLYISEPLPALFASEHFRETLLEFALRSGVRADFIVENRAYRLFGTRNPERAQERMGEVLDPKRCFWEKRRSGTEPEGKGRFFTNDLRDVWVDTLKGERPPAGSEYCHALDEQRGLVYVRNFDYQMKAYGFL